MELGNFQNKTLYYFTFTGFNSEEFKHILGYAHNMMDPNENFICFEWEPYGVDSINDRWDVSYMPAKYEYEAEESLTYYRGVSRSVPINSWDEFLQMANVTEEVVI